MMITNLSYQVWTYIFVLKAAAIYSHSSISSFMLVDFLLISVEARKAGDLRLKLQRKSFKQTSGTRSVSGVRDLREKLSGTMKPQPMNADPPRSKVEAAKSARRTVAVAALAPENHKVANTTSRKKTSKKARIL